MERCRKITTRKHDPVKQFLEKTAEYLVNTYGTELSDVAVVLPNRRAGLFLRRFMAEYAGKVCWSPVIFAVEDFITEISGLREAEPLSLLFDLYAVHQEVEKENAQPFEEFLHWAPQLLNDFNEIDRCLTDPHQLFSYLDEARVLSLWNLENQPLTEFETRYLRFYHSLEAYYHQLSSKLLSSRKGWQGLIFRHAAGNIREEVYRIPWKQVVFTGFNALTRAEEVIISELRLHKKATLLWDADPWYLNNEMQEAGTFLREWIRKWPSEEVRWVSDDFASGQKNIQVIGSPDAAGQVKFCGSLLQELARKGKATEATAVVLLDPSLLNPLLNSIPEEVTAMNITAGLALKQTPLADLFELIFRLQLNTGKFSNLRSSKAEKFYYKDVLSVLRHPMVQEMNAAMTGNNRFAFDETIEKIRQGSRIFIGKEELVRETADLFRPDPGFLEALFTRWSTPQDALTAFRSVIESLRMGLMQPDPGCEGADNRLEMEYLFSFTRIFHQLSTILEETHADLSLQTFYQLFRQVMESTSLPFSGEPLRGVQIMGMLETRTLDFENVILLSCNEDLLPAGKITPSFIPFDIKRNFELPTYRHKDAVYAYHFYRLLQRAENVWILYTTEATELGGGDKSRFLRQIEQELSAGNPGIRITSSLLASGQVKGQTIPVISVEKDEEVRKLMMQKAQTGFSATSLNAFRNCPLKFYLQELAGIRESEELAETIDPAIMGQAIHGTLATLFEPFTGKPLTPEAYQQMLKLADDTVLQSFDQKYKGSDVNFGKNLLLVNVARMIVRRFLGFEKNKTEMQDARAPFNTLMGTETRVPSSTLIKVEGADLSVNLKGFIDRVERIGDFLRIIDYKTGSVVKKNLVIEDWDDLVMDPDKDMAFQLLMYAFLLPGTFGDHPCSAAILPLKSLNGGQLEVSFPDDEDGKATSTVTAGTRHHFHDALNAILEAVFDFSVPFRQTDNPDTCKKCPYINLCRR